MAVNESKRGDSRMWAKWRRSGAVGTMVDSFLRPSGLIIDSIKTDPAAGTAILYLGRRVVSQGFGWSASKSLVQIKVSGPKVYQLGETVKKRPRK